MVVKVTGVRQTARIIERTVRRLSAAYRVQTSVALGELEGVASKYPPETAANQPAHGSYGPFYIRGEGQAYMRQSGEVRVYPTSEQLDRSWVKRIVARGKDIVGMTGPRASYGPYVVGDKQTSYHAKTGWPTLAGTVAGQFRRVVRGFVAVTVRVVGRG